MEKDEKDCQSHQNFSIVTEHGHRLTDKMVANSNIVKSAKMHPLQDHVLLGTKVRV